jgi:hypothetical protein
MWSKTFSRGARPLNDGEYILFMTREHGHFTRFSSLATLDKHEEGSVLSRIYIAHPQIAQFCPAKPTGLGELNVCLPMRRLEVPIMAGRDA